MNRCRLFRRVMNAQRHLSTCKPRLKKLNSFVCPSYISLAKVSTNTVLDTETKQYFSHTNKSKIIDNRDNVFNVVTKIDPRRLPNTIPGVTQEELANKIMEQYTKMEQEQKEARSKQIEHEIEEMRLALSEKDFAEYMRNLQVKLNEESAEAAKVASMNSVEYHIYQQKQRRWLFIKQWSSILLIVGMIGGTVFSVLYLFAFFY